MIYSINDDYFCMLKLNVMGYSFIFFHVYIIISEIVRTTLPTRCNVSMNAIENTEYLMERRKRVDSPRKAKHPINQISKYQKLRKKHTHTHQTYDETNNRRKKSSYAHIFCGWADVQTHILPCNRAYKCMDTAKRKTIMANKVWEQI